MGEHVVSRVNVERGALLDSQPVSVGSIEAEVKADAEAEDTAEEVAAFELLQRLRGGGCLQSGGWRKAAFLQSFLVAWSGMVPSASATIGPRGMTPMISDAALTAVRKRCRASSMIPN